MATELLLITAAVFLMLSIAMSKFAAKSRVPALLLFLILGMVAGSEGVGGIYFDNPPLVGLIGVTAMAFILFSGGLDMQWRNVRPVLVPGLTLSTLGVLITAASIGVFAQLALGFSLLEGVLFGAIIASTDAAAVFSLLRGQNIGRLKPLLELESGSNDPMAVFLTVGILQLLTTPDLPVTALLPLFVMQMGIGAVLGYASGRAAVVFINRSRLEYDGLYPVLSIALVLVVYGVTSAIGGNGFLAVYLSGLVMAQRSFVHKRSLLSFHDAIAWLMQIVMFVMLGLQVFPSQLVAIAAGGLIVALFLVFVARPISVFIALILVRLRLREKLFISWVGLRGAAPIVLATFPITAGIEKAQIIFNLVFFVVLISVLVQGVLMIPIARLLRVIDPTVTMPRSPLAYVMRDGMIADNLVEIDIKAESPTAGQQIVSLGLADDTRIILIGRGEEMLVPHGGTVIEPGDRLLVLTQTAKQAEVRRQLGEQL